MIAVAAWIVTCVSLISLTVVAVITFEKKISQEDAFNLTVMLFGITAIAIYMCTLFDQQKLASIKIE